MDKRTLETENGAVADHLPDLDMEHLVEQIWTDLQGTVGRSTIRHELAHVIPKYADARIRIYVPLFLRRETVERLRPGLAGV